MFKLNKGGGQPRQLGQAMVEYALILVLLALAFGVALAITGPAIGNVFCNVVDNLGGDTISPQGGNCGESHRSLVEGNPASFWGTVTWVAQHPQHETPFPTPLRRAEAGSGGGIPPTNTPTYTPTATNTATATNTPTQTDTFTPGPSPTNGDFAFAVPHVDQINNPEWWRLDTGDFMGYTNWNVTWYDDMSTTTNPGGWLNILLGAPLFPDQTLGADINGIQYDWGSGVGNPGLTCCSVWGAAFTRTITVAQTAVYKFSLVANNYANVVIDDVNGGNPIVYRASSGSSEATMLIPAGTHTLHIYYAQNAGTAQLHFNVERLSVNPDDVVVGTNTCTWGRSGDTNNPVSVTWMFDENPASDAWTSGQTCYLELRGYVDLTGKANPVFSYWDIWDFQNASAVTAQLQVSRYVKDVNGFLDRGQLNWQTVATRSAGTRNYTWTRNQIDLSAIGGLTNYVTFRFVIGSGSPGSAPFRWYIDDLQVVENPAPTTTFTVGNDWDLNSAAQKSDFIYDGDSYDNSALTDAIGPRRWDLTSAHAHSGMSWDDSPAGAYQNITGLSPASPTGAAQARVHFLELKYPVDLSIAPAEDAEHDDGEPLLSFWHAFDIQPGASIRVQYTRDAQDATPDNWIDIPNQGVLIDYAIPTGTSRTNLSMQPVEINLSNIPDYLTIPFRLRFALYVDGAATTFGDGWYIDDIRLERESDSPYLPYPLRDDAESTAFTNAVWDQIGGKWGPTTEKNGVAGSATAYADSPGTLYDANDVQMLQQHFAIDLLHDTPANTSNPADSAAVNPVLTFWHQRYLGADVVFRVEAWTPRTGVWQPIWTYDSNTTAPTFNTQRAWERVEINLTTAIPALYSPSATWSDITSNADGILDDDDVKIRFYFATGSATVADGVYVDDIHIENGSTATHRLWPTAAGGDGEYLDSVETITPGISTWSQRWYAGGSWGTTGGTGYTHSGSQSFTDSVFGNYGDNTYSVIELVPTIDLTTASGGAPMLTFWTRFEIGADDAFSVQIATEDGSTTQGYDKIGGWSAWTTQPLMAGVPAPGDVLTNTTVVTWLRGQVNLAGFVGHRIRVRFLMSVPNTTTQADGIFVDDVKFGYTTRQISLDFTDPAQTTANWITEGTWGLGQNYFLGGGSTDLGATTWSGTYFDCEQLKLSTEDCGLPATYTRILNDTPNLSPLDSYRTSGPRIGPENTPTISFNWGSADRPLNNTSEDPAYRDTFAARWTRTVTLQGNTTYRFYTVSDDGVRLRISDVTDTDIADDPLTADNSGIIIERWDDHSAMLDYATFTVTSATPITRTLTLEYYEDGMTAEIILNATSSRYSFTDSPNPPVGSGFNYVASVYPGNSSLMLNGFFDLSAAATPALRYKILYDLTANSFFYVEVSTDGGFSWSQLSSLTLNNTSRLPPAYDWLEVTADLRPSATAPYNYLQPNVMIRFRLDTRTATALNGGTGDGVYLTDIRVND